MSLFAAEVMRPEVQSFVWSYTGLSCNYVMLYFDICTFLEIISARLF